MATAQTDTAVEQLRGRIQHLTGEVQRLQRELGDAHSADYNTLKRAYVSLVQHFRALQIEAQVLKAHINALDVEVMNPDEVADQLTAVAAVAAVAAAAGRLFRHPRLAPLRIAVWSAGALFLGWRFTTASFGRMGSLLVQNRQRKRRLQQDWEALVERIRIMDDLTRWEGQDPALRPPSASPGPGSSEGEGSATSGWVDVRHALCRFCLGAAFQSHLNPSGTETQRCQAANYVPSAELHPVPFRMQTQYHSLETLLQALLVDDPDPASLHRATRSQADEAEGRVSYPKPYTPAASNPAADEDEGVIAYPQVQAAQGAAEEDDGQVFYPGFAAGSSGSTSSAKKKGRGGGQLRAEDLPSAPPMPEPGASAAAEKEAEKRQRVPAMQAL